MQQSPLRPPRQRKQPSPHTTKNQPLRYIPPTQQQQLLSYNDIPAWYSDNPYILTGYRPISNSTQSCLSSLFYLHNESVNIYTHLVPSISLLLAEWTLYQYIQIWYPHAAIQDQAIFAFFLLTATICLGMSAIFHTLMNHSEKVCNRWLQLDFIGIVILTMGNFVSGIHMVFYCERRLKYIYWGMTGILGASSLMVLVNPRFQGLQWRTFRVGTFMAMGLSGIAPLVHGVAVFGFSQMMRQSGAPFYIAEGVLLGLGAVVYTARVPESFGPGKFDIFGSSHQIFHVLVVLATVLQFAGILWAYDYNYYNRVCDF
ncbi:hemolysin-III channel protein Izh2 [Penicillium odoratum]|uniref:hemolysin-III channel protein Izh2 n=1 Tax=Penicillium odoratum TaxID=1167516 RepID=UPI0025476A6C|nr:hemolysin-III channel protein Izh2 [Penicillium odoratum]KAJ5759046.1 hemolysin-III channel protein Izh2 [Penicillium odoratum]